jgi:hypothetical protein
VKNVHVALNEETRSMVSMIRTNRGLCADIAAYIAAGKTPDWTAARLKHGVIEKLAPELKSPALRS